jgi:SAM-dependent methyltransferase
MKKKLLNDILQWDIKNWGVALDYWEENVELVEANLKCLELGGRQGGLSLWLALKGHQVICSDLTETKKNAEKIHNQYTLPEVIEYKDIDATDIPFSNYFDIIVFKSIIGGIGYNNNKINQQKAFESIYTALKPGGKLLFAENLEGSFLHRFFRRRFTKWGNAWRYITLEETKTFLEKFKHVTIQTTGVLGTFGRNEKQRKLLATLDHIALNKLLPKSAKYIVYGIAEK